MVLWIPEANLKLKKKAAKIKHFERETKKLL